MACRVGGLRWSLSRASYDYVYLFLLCITAVTGPIMSGLLLQHDGGALGGKFGKSGFGNVEIFVGSCAVATSIGGLVVAAVKNRTRATGVVGGAGS